MAALLSVGVPFAMSWGQLRRRPLLGRYLKAFRAYSGLSIYEVSLDSWLAQGTLGRGSLAQI